MDSIPKVTCLPLMTTCLVPATRRALLNNDEISAEIVPAAETSTVTFPRTVPVLSKAVIWIVTVEATETTWNEILAPDTLLFAGIGVFSAVIVMVLFVVPSVEANMTVSSLLSGGGIFVGSPTTFVSTEVTTVMTTGAEVGPNVVGAPVVVVGGCVVVVVGATVVVVTGSDVFDGVGVNVVGSGVVDGCGEVTGVVGVAVVGVDVVGA